MYIQDLANTGQYHIDFLIRVEAVCIKVLRRNQCVWQRG